MEVGVAKKLSISMFFRIESEKRKEKDESKRRKSKRKREKGRKKLVEIPMYIRQDLNYYIKLTCLMKNLLLMAYEGDSHV
jgi:hypothetical protein